MSTNTNKYRLRIVDTSLLEDKAFLKFLDRQPSNTIVYVPDKARQIAQEVWRTVVEILPEHITLCPHMAVKALNIPEVIGAVFDEEFLPDVASIQEVRLSKYASRGKYKASNMNFSNVWVSEKDIHKLVQMGVRRFVVDKRNTVDWIMQAADKYHEDRSSFQILIRVMLENPDAKGGQGAKFGLPSAKVPDMARYIQKHGIIAAGLAFHMGTSNSYEYMHPEMFDLPPVLKPEGDLFDNYSASIRMIAPLFHELRSQGLLGNIINTEGGYRQPCELEYDWRDELRSQAQTLAELFNNPDDPILWFIEPGRLFTACGIGKITITNVDDAEERTNMRYVGTDAGLYAGWHDGQWERHSRFLLRHLMEGNLYTPHSHPELFDKFILVDQICAGSGQWEIRSERPYTRLVKDVAPGDEMIILPVGSYTSSLSPYAYQRMLGISTRGNYGFNGVQWPRIVVFRRKFFLSSLFQR